MREYNVCSDKDLKELIDWMRRREAARKAFMKEFGIKAKALAMGISEHALGCKLAYIRNHSKRARKLETPGT